MRRALLCLVAVFVSLGTATEVSACRIAQSGVIRTEAEQDARDMGSVDVAAIGVVTTLVPDPIDPAAVFTTREILRGSAPGTFAYGGGEVVIVTCYPQPAYPTVIQGLRQGDEVLIFAANIDANRPFDVMKLDDPRAIRLLATLRSDRTVPQ